MRASRLKTLHLAETGTDLTTILSINHKKLQSINIEHNKLKDWKMLDSSIFEEFNMKFLTDINVSSTFLPIENFLAVLLAKDGQYAVTARNNNLYDIVFLFSYSTTPNLF
jgi:hypothetical protein